jgi:hypothetical protein
MEKLQDKKALWEVQSLKDVGIKNLFWHVKNTSDITQFSLWLESYADYSNNIQIYITQINVNNYNLCVYIYMPAAQLIIPKA